MVNPLKWPFQLIKYTITDTIDDIKYLKKAWKTGEWIDPSKKEILKREWKELTFMSVLKENWIWFLLLILAFTVGWFVASQHYQDLCNRFIIDNFLNNTGQLVEESYMKFNELGGFEAFKNVTIDFSLDNLSS